MAEHILSADTKTAQAIELLGPWYHNIILPDQTQTLPKHPLGLGDYPRCKWELFENHLPEDLTGCTALDIGCNAGYCSIELARRGAKVLAIDHDPHYLRQARWIVKQWDMENLIAIQRMSVYKLPKLQQTFDIVLFLDVLHHLRYPMLGMDIVAQVSADLMIFQTFLAPGDEVQQVPVDIAMNETAHMAEAGYPQLAFIEHLMAGDPTNWWLPNRAAAEAMLRSAGFTINEHPAPQTYICSRNGDRG